MIKWLFRVAPEVGSVWKLNDRDPFTKAAFLVKVLEVKRGWVQYTTDPEDRYNSPPISTTVRVFRDLYREL